jgi:hypothetical protein
MPQRLSDFPPRLVGAGPQPSGPGTEAAAEPVAHNQRKQQAGGDRASPLPCQRAQRELSMTRQKLMGWKLLSLSASTSALTVPNVLFGRCFIPS